MPKKEPSLGGTSGLGASIDISKLISNQFNQTAATGYKKIKTDKQSYQSSNLIAAYRKEKTR